jgi:hypothetical protein
MAQFPITTPTLPGLPPPEIPLINRESGRMDRVWYDYFKSLDVLMRLVLSRNVP